MKSVIYAIVLVFIYILTHYKLLRLNTFYDISWSGHIFLLAPLLILSGMYYLGFLQMLPVLQRRNGSLLIFMFIVGFIILQLIIFNRGDQYLVAGLSAFIFFLVFQVAQKWPQDTLKIIEVTFTLMLMTSIFEVISHFARLEVFDYFKNDRFAPSTLSTVHPILGFRGRPSGFSGSVYATAAMLAGVTIYFFRERKFFRFSLGMLAQFLYATPSVFLVLLLFLFWGRLNIWRLILMLLICSLMLPILQYRLNETNELQHWLPTSEIGYSAKELFIGLIFGFGVHSPKIDPGEFRIISLIASWGVVVTTLLTYFYLRLCKLAGTLQQVKANNVYKNLLVVPLIMFACNWHYETLMTFPNSLIAVVIFAIIVAEYKKLNYA